MGSTEVQEQLEGSAPAGGTAARPSRTPSDQPTIDWSGRSLLADADGDDGSAGDPDTTGPSGTRRLAILAGIVSFAYIAWVVVDLVVLAVSGTAYTSMHRALSSLGARSVLCVAWLALLHHGLDGLRIVATEFVPRLRARDRLLRGLVAFVLFAVWIPTALIIVWPAIRGWFAA